MIKKLLLLSLLAFSACDDSYNTEISDESNVVKAEPIKLLSCDLEYNNEDLTDESLCYITSGSDTEYDSNITTDTYQLFISTLLEIKVSDDKYLKSYEMSIKEQLIPFCNADWNPLFLEYFGDYRYQDRAEVFKVYYENQTKVISWIITDLNYLGSPDYIYPHQNLVAFPCNYEG